MNQFVFNCRRIKCCDWADCFVHDADGMHEVCDWLEWPEFHTLIHNLTMAGALERARRLGADPIRLLDGEPWVWKPGCDWQAP